MSLLRIIPANVMRAIGLQFLSFSLSFFELSLVLVSGQRRRLFVVVVCCGFIWLRRVLVAAGGL